MCRSAQSMSYRWVIVFHASDYMIMLKESSVQYPTVHSAELALSLAFVEELDTPGVPGQVGKYILCIDDHNWILIE